MRHRRVHKGDDSEAAGEDYRLLRTAAQPPGARQLASRSVGDATFQLLEPASAFRPNLSTRRERCTSLPQALGRAALRSGLATRRAQPRVESKQPRMRLRRGLVLPRTPARYSVSQKRAPDLENRDLPNSRLRKRSSR